VEGEVAEYVSLDDQLAMFQQILNGQDKRECMVRLASMKAPVALRTLDVPPPWVSDEDVQAYLQERFRSLPYALRLDEAIERATKRERDFLQSVADIARVAFARQLDAYIRRLTPPAGLADRMRGELEKERDEDTVADSVATEAIRLHIKDDEERLERLMQGYLDRALSLEEYRKAKARIINEKKQKEEDLAELERHRSGWFEPAIRFVNDLKTAEMVASSHNPAEKLEFAKTTGSNFRLVNRELVSLPRDAWQLVVDQGSFAQSNTAPAIAGAVFAGETHHDYLQRRR